MSISAVAPFEFSLEGVFVGAGSVCASGTSMLPKMAV